MEKVALVTGVGPGTGSAIARRFHEGGYRVAALARDGARLDRLSGRTSGLPAHRLRRRGSRCAERFARSRRRGRSVRSTYWFTTRCARTRGDVLQIDPQDLERNFAIKRHEPAAPRAVDSPEHDRTRSGRDHGDRQHGGPARQVLSSPGSHRPKRPSGYSRSRWRGASDRTACTSPTSSSMRSSTCRGRVPPFRTNRTTTPRSPPPSRNRFWQVAHQDRSAWSFDVELRPFGETW